jgi:integrase
MQERNENMPATKDESKNGTWRYQKLITHPITGERVFLRKRGFKSKREAELAEAMVVSEIVGLNDAGALPFKFVLDDFLSYKSKRVNARSFEKISRLINGYIREHVEKYDMRLYSASDARRFYDHLIDEQRSNNFKNQIIELLKSVFRFAETMHGLKSNPVRNMEKFKTYKAKKNFQVYSIEEFFKFINTFSEENDYEFSMKLFFSVLFWSGLRRGECKGLKWNDINYSTFEIRVDEQFIDKDPNLGRICTRVKTENALRSVLVDRRLMSMFKHLHNYRKQHPEYNDNEFIFLRQDRTIPFADNTIDKRNAAHAKKAGLRKIRIHDFRHSFATMNYALGADAKTISSQLGHSSLTITLDIYINMFADKNHARVSLIEDAKNKYLDNK